MASVAALMLKAAAAAMPTRTMASLKKCIGRSRHKVRKAYGSRFILINYIQATQRLRQEPAGSRGEASRFHVSQQQPPLVLARYFTVTR